jgi:hypothetical protein
MKGGAGMWAGMQRLGRIKSSLDNERNPTFLMPKAGKTVLQTIFLIYPIIYPIIIGY